MLLRSHVLDGVRNGTISLAFRRWRRPTVRSGGTLLTAIGQLGIENVAIVHEPDISDDDARRAGYSSLSDLLRALNTREEGDIYRITFGDIVADPRFALRESLPDDAELTAIFGRLRQMDARAEGYIDDYHFLTPTGESSLQVMYVTITDGAIAPISVAAVLLNP